MIVLVCPLYVFRHGYFHLDWFPLTHHQPLSIWYHRAIAKHNVIVSAVNHDLTTYIYILLFPSNLSFLPHNTDPAFLHMVLALKTDQRIIESSILTKSIKTVRTLAHITNFIPDGTIIFLLPFTQSLYLIAVRSNVKLSVRSTEDIVNLAPFSSNPRSMLGGPVNGL